MDDSTRSSRLYPDDQHVGHHVAGATPALDEAQIKAFAFQIAHAVAAELQTESSAGNPLVETLASSLTARLVQKHANASFDQSLPRLTAKGLDRRRLARVLEYVEANLEGDLSLDRLASIACLSRHHFARAFKQALGRPPRHYVNARRFERAKAWLIQGDRSLVDIALALSFSDQANFTRAFKQATGQTPGQYRQRAGLRSLAPLLA
jgi:AraC family transcriptional regulator